MMAAERYPAPSVPVSRVSTRRGRWPVLAGGAVAVGAAAAVAVTVALPAGRVASSGRPAAEPGTSAAAPAAQTFLLTSATAAARSSAATGTYWYVRERDYEPAIAKSGRLKQARKLSFGATFAATEESWTGQHRARTIVNEDLVFTFASAADRARWVAAGKPALSTAAGFGVGRTVTSDYSMTMRGGVGRYQLSVADFQRLPVNAGGLGKLLRSWWASEPDKAGAVGFKNPSYAQYLVQWADVLLTGPARSGTRAAIYELLAKQPGLMLIPGVTDPLGRAGVAVGDGGGDYLIIQPGTARLLAYASHPVRANSVLPGSAGLAVYEVSGWAGQLGVSP
jgi:hypothetical protein